VTDLNYALRALARRPGYTAVAVLMLAIGTAATTTMFAVVDGVLLRSPFARPQEIAAVTAVNANGQVTRALPREAYEQLTARSHLFAAVAELGISSPILTGVETPRRAQVECVPASMAAVLGAAPLMGRWFSESEDRPGGPAIALVSHRFWQATLGGARRMCWAGRSRSTASR
jgi:hypothetical protein